MLPPYSTIHFFITILYVRMINTHCMARLTISEASTKHSSSLRDFVFSHLNFYTSIYPPFNLAYNDAIRTKSIWKFCWERLIFHGFFAANAVAPPLATDALKATDTFPPDIITMMPMFRMNVAACSQPTVSLPMNPIFSRRFIHRHKVWAYLSSHSEVKCTWEVNLRETNEKS